MSTNPHEFGDPNRQGQYPPPPQWNSSQPEDNPAPANYPPASQYPVSLIYLGPSFPVAFVALFYLHSCPDDWPLRALPFPVPVNIYSYWATELERKLTDRFSILRPPILLQPQTTRIRIHHHPRHSIRLPPTWPLSTLMCKVPRILIGSLLLLAPTALRMSTLSQLLHHSLKLYTKPQLPDNGPL